MGIPIQTTSKLSYYTQLLQTRDLKSKTSYSDFSIDFSFSTLAIMPSTSAHSTFSPMANGVYPESSSRGIYTIYTGEYRQSFRERIQRLREQKGMPKLQRRDTPIPRKRTSSSSSGNPPRTPPPMPVLISECPGAPRKGKVSELRRTSPIALNFNEDMLLDRKGIERARASPDGSGYATPTGRNSPLRNSWGPFQRAETIEDLRPLLDKVALSKGTKEDSVKKVVRFRGI